MNRVAILSMSNNVVLLLTQLMSKNVTLLMNKKINTDIIPRIGHLDNVVSDLGKDVVSSVESNTKAIQDLGIEILKLFRKSSKHRKTELTQLTIHFKV